LGFVFVAELVPMLYFVAEPFSQRRAGRKVFAPGVVMQLFLGNTPGPKAVDQDAVAVALGSFLIGTLDVDLYLHEKSPQSLCVMSRGTIHSSYCCAVTWPSASAASRKVVPSFCAFLAMAAALS